MKKKSTNKVVKKVVKSEYTATVDIFGRKYISTGATVADAIRGLKPTNAKGKSILSIEKDGIRQERVLPHMFTARLFGPASGMIKEIILKQASQRFHD